MRILARCGPSSGDGYVSAPAAVVLGALLGGILFASVYPGQPQIGIIDIPFTVIGEDSAFVIGEMLDYAYRTDSIKGVVIKLVTPGGATADSENLYLSRHFPYQAAWTQARHHARRKPS